MLGQLNMYGMDRVETAIERLKAYEPPEGYWLAFNRNSYGFEIDKNFYKRATTEMLADVAIQERMVLEVG